MVPVEILATPLATLVGVLFDKRSVQLHKLSSFVNKLCSAIIHNCKHLFSFSIFYVCDSISTPESIFSTSLAPFVKQGVLTRQVCVVCTVRIELNVCPYYQNYITLRSLVDYTHENPVLVDPGLQVNFSDKSITTYYGAPHSGTG